MSFVEFTGKARLDKRTKRLVHRLGPDDIAIIDQDIDRVSAELARAARACAWSSTSHGRRPAMPRRRRLAGARARRRPADRRAGNGALRRGARGGGARRSRCDLFRNGTRLAAGHTVTVSELENILSWSSAAGSRRRSRTSRTTRSATFASKLLSEGVQLPQLHTTFRDRHALVVARDPGYKRDLKTIRSYIRDFKPVLVGVDGGADALLEEGYKPDVIVGDMDSVTDKALVGAELVVHAYPSGSAPGRERLDRMGLPSTVVPSPASARTSPSCSRTRRGAELIVAVGTHFNLTAFLEQPRRRIVHVPPPEGGGEAR